MHTMQDIAQALAKMKFRKKTFGVVEEADVWRKLESLQNLYQQVYDEQAAYYQAILDQKDQELDRLRGSKGGGDAHA